MSTFANNLMSDTKVTNINHNDGVVVIGSNNVVHVPTSSDSSDVVHKSLGVLPDHQDEEKIVEKVSQNFRQDYLRNLAKMNRNPLKQCQSYLSDFVVNVTLKAIDDKPKGAKDSLIVNDIFESTHEQRILITGAPFTGKTTLVQKLAFDWAKHLLPCLEHFKVVFFIKLCQSRDFSLTLQDIFEREELGNENEKKVFFDYMKRKPQEFLLLIDGIDECELDDGCELKELLNGHIYKNLPIIVTSRPHIQNNWFELSKTFHSRYEIYGLSEQNIENYIENYFGDNKKTSKALKEFVQRNSDLMNLARYPLVVLTLCKIWDEKNQSCTATILLQMLIQMVINLSMRKTGRNMDIIDVLLSFDTLIANNASSTEFTEEKLESCQIDVNIGLIVAHPEKRCYHFIDELILDFFIARTTIGCETAENSFHSHKHSVLKFMAGLLIEKEVADSEIKFLKELSNFPGFFENCYCRKMDTFLACLAESWTNEKSPEILDICKDINLFRKTEETFEMSGGAVQGLALLVKKLKVEKLNLNGIIISSSNAKLIASECLTKNNFLKIVKLKSFLSPAAVAAICEGLSDMLRIESIDLSCCHYSDQGLQAIANLLHENKGAIKYLHLGNCLNIEYMKIKPIEYLTKFQEICEVQPASEESIKNLILSLENAVELTDLSLPCSCVGTTCFQDWINMFSANTTLSHVMISVEKLTKDMLDDFVHLVNNHMTQLKVLKIVTKTANHDLKEDILHVKDSVKKLELIISDHTYSTRFLRLLSTA